MTPIRCGCLVAAMAAMTQVPASAMPLDPLAFGSLGTLSLGAGSYTIDTSGAAPTLSGSGGTIATGVITNQSTTFDPAIAVFDFSSISIDSGATIVVSGPNPLALLSRTGFTFAGSLDASGGPGGNQNAGAGGTGGPGGGAGGAGGSGSGSGSPGDGPGGGGGGFAGLGNGSWGEGGAFGGDGTNRNPALTPAVAYGDLHAALQGGSGGGGSGPNVFGSGAGGGGGGGAVEFGATSFLTFAGGSEVLANGGLGGGGLGVIAGQGSGGGVLLHAPSIEFQTDANGVPTVAANGDSGGRIMFVTQDGTVAGNLSGVTVGKSAELTGHEGVITFRSVSPVPEPAEWALLLAGGTMLAGLGSARRARPTGV